MHSYSNAYNSNRPGLAGLIMDAPAGCAPSGPSPPPDNQNHNGTVKPYNGIVTTTAYQSSSLSALLVFRCGRVPRATNEYSLIWIAHVICDRTRKDHSGFAPRCLVYSEIRDCAQDVVLAWAYVSVHGIVQHILCAGCTRVSAVDVESSSPPAREHARLFGFDAH